MPDGRNAASGKAVAAMAELRADARRNRGELLDVARQVIAEEGVDASLRDIARRAGVGIGTLYRHFPTRLALQEGVFRSQVETVCARGRELAEDPSPGDAFAAWLRVLTGFLATKRGLSHALISTLGKDSELISSCGQVMRTTAEQLLERAQQAGTVRKDLTAMDVMRLMHGIGVAVEQTPGDADRMLSLLLDGVRARPAT
jgi:AcrR family transcriptional regulator